MTEIRISEKIFEDNPTFRRGIVIAKNLQNSGHSKELETMLDQAVIEAGNQQIDIKNDPLTIPWSQAHRQFGSNPNKYPPAHCALIKRVQKTGAQIPFINKTVAIMNYNSISSIMPVGGDDLNKAGEILELRYAEGNENFTPLGKPEHQEQPESGEIVYVVHDTGDVMCRRWNWRNGHKTCITEETQAIVMNIDGLGEDSEARSIVTRDRVAEMLEDFCQAEVIKTLLSPSQPFYQF
ncbi:B3/4 domain-containing protein [Thermodesulfobacteriota bacterium]